MLAVTPTEWTERVKLLMDSEARKMSQGPYWASLHSLHQPTEWFNSILARLWPFYDAPISQCAAASHVMASLSTDALEYRAIVARLSTQKRVYVSRG